MSKIFYDHLITFETIDSEIKSSDISAEEKEELWCLIDETVQQSVIICILDSLPSEHHSDFLEKFHACPYDTALIDYLNEKVEDDIEELISQRMKALEREILEEITDDL